MKNFLFTLFLASLLLSPASAVHLDVHDSVLESGRYGTDVVLLSVAYVQQAAIFADNSKLLQRIAYVETQDGSDREAFKEGMKGGIWAVREDIFTRTQIGRDFLLVQKREQIMHIFGINWKGLRWSELSKPLYSALAAQLVLFTAQDSIPSDSDVLAQAHFWRENYNADGVIQDFINAAERLEGGFSQHVQYTVLIEVLTCFCKWPR